MRKKLVVAGWFPANRGAEGEQIDGGEVQIGLAGEMPVRGFGKLGGGGEVDIAVGLVDGGAGERAAPQIVGLGLGEDFIGDWFGHGVSKPFWYGGQAAAEK